MLTTLILRCTPQYHIHNTPHFYSVYHPLNTVWSCDKFILRTCKRIFYLLLSSNGKYTCYIRSTALSYIYSSSHLCMPINIIVILTHAYITPLQHYACYSRCLLNLLDVLENQMCFISCVQVWYR